MSEVHGAVGSYVVNALDGAELDEFEAHLAVCDTCQREVIEFSETAAQLGSLVETAPPPALRGSILAAIREVRPLPPEMPAGREDAPPPVSRVPTPAAVEPVAPVIDELALRRQRRTARILSLAVAAALVLALSLGGWVFNLVRERQAQVAETTLTTQLWTAPDAKVYAKTLLDGTRVSYVVSKSLNKAQFVGNDMPSPGAGKQYQLWTLEGPKAVPDTVMDGGTVTTAWFTGSIKDATGLAVTIEPKGGSPLPTGKVQADTQL